MLASSYVSPKAVKSGPSTIEGRGLVAVAPIVKDEVVLTTDYALFDDYNGEMPCRCRTPSCRRVINGRDWRRPELQRRYPGYFSWYLQRRFS